LHQPVLFLRGIVHDMHRLHRQQLPLGLDLFDHVPVRLRRQRLHLRPVHQPLLGLHRHDDSMHVLYQQLPFVRLHLRHLLPRRHLPLWLHLPGVHQPVLHLLGQRWLVLSLVYRRLLALRVHVLALVPLRLLCQRIVLRPVLVLVRHLLGIRLDLSHLRVWPVPLRRLVPDQLPQRHLRRRPLGQLPAVHRPLRHLQHLGHHVHLVQLPLPAQRRRVWHVLPQRHLRVLVHLRQLCRPMCHVLVRFHLHQLHVEPAALRRIVQHNLPLGHVPE